MAPLCKFTLKTFCHFGVGKEKSGYLTIVGTPPPPPCLDVFWVESIIFLFVHLFDHGRCALWDIRAFAISFAAANPSPLPLPVQQVFAPLIILAWRYFCVYLWMRGRVVCLLFFGSTFCVINCNSFLATKYIKGESLNAAMSYVLSLSLSFSLSFSLSLSRSLSL